MSWKVGKRKEGMNEGRDDRNGGSMTGNSDEWGMVGREE